MLAESFFQTSDFVNAEEAFSEVTEKNSFYAQSLFRLAELERKKGNEKKALTFFEKIVEKGNSPRWKRFAEQELQYAKAAALM